MKTLCTMMLILVLIVSARAESNTTASFDILQYTNTPGLSFGLGFYGPKFLPYIRMHASDIKRGELTYEYRGSVLGVTRHLIGNLHGYTGIGYENITAITQPIPLQDHSVLFDVGLRYHWCDCMGLLFGATTNSNKLFYSTETRYYIGISFTIDN